MKKSFAYKVGDRVRVRYDLRHGAVGILDCFGSSTWVSLSVAMLAYRGMVGRVLSVKLVNNTPVYSLRFEGSKATYWWVEEWLVPTTRSIIIDGIRTGLKITGVLGLCLAWVFVVIRLFRGLLV